MKNQHDIFIEDLYRDKVFSGATPVFDKKSLIFKENSAGVRGGHAARAYKPNEIIISIENSAALNLVRAFDETKDMLASLGSDKYNLPEFAALALAVYKRYSENAEKDALFATVDFEKSYRYTPMAGMHKEFAEFFHFNSRREIWEANFIEESIRKIGVDFDIYCLCVAYVKSRRFLGTGVVAGIDVFNSSVTSAANAYFKNFENKYAILAVRDIKPGEEITWSYNSADAFSTFYSYGYHDPERIYRCDYVYRIEGDEVQKFIDTWAARNDFKENHIRRSEYDYLDVNQYDFILLCPGGGSTSFNKLGQVALAITCYKALLTLVRMRLVVKENLDALLYVPLDQADKHFCVYGIEFDLKCFDLMLQELRNSKDLFNQRLKKFRDSSVGSLCDLTPAEEINGHAYTEWENCLIFMKQLIVVESVVDACRLIAEHTGQVFEADKLKSMLDQSADEFPDLRLALAKEILSEKCINGSLGTEM